MKTIAHRGLSALYPENTLLAFQKALESGADGIETDLRLTKDDEIVLFHDKDLMRVSGHNDAVETLTREALKRFDVGLGERIPTVDELLALVKGRCTLILEIKYHPDTYKKLCELLAHKISDKLSWVEVSCFDDRVLETMYHLNRKIKLHKLIDNEALLFRSDLDKKYAFVSYYDIEVSLRKNVLALGLFEKKKVIFWTVEHEDLSKEKKAGLYGVMSNMIPLSES